MPTTTLTTVLTSLETTAHDLAQHVKDLTALILGARTTATANGHAPAATTPGWRKMNAKQRRAYLARKTATKATPPPRLKLLKKRAA